MTDEAASALAVGDATFRRCVVAGEFIASTVRQALQPLVRPGAAGEVLCSQLVRIDYWMRSLGKLTEPTDFQAVTAGCRAILECIVDIALIRANPDDYQKVLDWEDSAKLKHALALATYCANNRGEDENHRSPLEFAQRERERINAIRLKHGWVERPKRTGRTVEEKPKHPLRWTNRDLGTDCREADKAQAGWAPDIEGPPIRLEHFYETRYRELCWTTHGSGFVLRGISTHQLNVAVAWAFYDCARLALVAASWVVRHFELWNDAMLDSFNQAAARMEAVYQATLAAHRPGQADEEASEG